ncbi:MAG: prepilin peptidase [Gemmatimonadetes bacterium]|nr:prepilin peptidase [Gemmatimonadota bacterium]
MAPDAWIPGLAGLLGLVLGSFLNVCTLRWPVGESVVHPPSRCPGCGAGIAPWDNVPVLGWLWLRGRCRNCAEPISVQYPLVELTTGLIWAGCAWQWGLSWEALRAATFMTIVLGIAVSDARFYIIPDAFSLGGALLGVALAFAPGGIEPTSALVGAVVGFGGFWLVGVLGTWIVRLRNPDRLAEAFDAHDEQRADPVVQGRVAVLARPAARLALLALAGLVIAGVGFRWGAAGFWVAAPTMLAAVAILLAWVESFEDATFEAEREAEGQGASAADEGDDVPISALGGGDVRMMALVGAFLGPIGVLWTTLGGSLLALVAAVPLTLIFRQLIPLGIFLAYAAAATWLWGDAVGAWYLAYTGIAGP